LLYTPDREHFGIVPIEAMNAGTPAICVASGGPLETILHGLSGFLCQQTAKDFGLAMKKFTIKSISDIERLKLTDTIAEYTKNGSKNRYSKIKKLNYLDKTLSLSQLMGLIGREHVQVGYTLILASYVENYCFFL
jgi:glycosyltransferase involved in cell wall biosynthesis